jgi:endonuclease-3 related protein
MNFKQVFQGLFDEYGPQHWWPGDTPFEVMVGAILTQNTAWINVERAIANLKANKALSAEGILAAPEKVLAEWLRPSGYFNIKAKRLRNFCRWYMGVGQYDALSTWDSHTLRKALLSVNGVGPETADDMMLYAFERPVFVIDAYTRRLFRRLGLITGDETYEQLRTIFEENLPADVLLFNEYHALIVQHAKDICKKRPQCDECLFAEKCGFEDMD